MIAVMSVMTTTSVTGYWPSLLDLRKRHQERLPLMKIVPTIPCNGNQVKFKNKFHSRLHWDSITQIKRKLTPMMPSATNGTSSKKIHGLRYSTKNSTVCSLPNGLIDRRMNAAMRAQKNDRHNVFIGK